MWPFDKFTIEEAIQIAKDRGLIRGPINWDLDFKDKNGNRILISSRFTQVYIKVNGILIAGNFMCDFGEKPEVYEIVSVGMSKVRSSLDFRAFINHRDFEIASVLDGVIEKKILSKSETLLLVEIALHCRHVTTSVSLTTPRFPLFRYVQPAFCKEFQIPVWTWEDSEDVAI